MKPIKDFKAFVVYEDQYLIACNKPPDIATEGSSSEEPDFAHYLKKYSPGAAFVHRLDRETSGLVLAARTPEAYSALSGLFAKRNIEKVYVALIEGAVDLDNLYIELPLLKQSVGKAVVSHAHGKPAVTLVNTAEIFRNYTLITAEPLTGRFHQIRAHMASQGKPLVGDSLYNGNPFYLSEVKRRYKVSKNEEEQPILSRTALHARRLVFEHPFTQEKMELVAELPKDFRVAVELLRKYDT